MIPIAAPGGHSFVEDAQISAVPVPSIGSPLLVVDPILQHLRGLEQGHFYLACSKFGILTTAYFCPGFHRATEQLQTAKKLPVRPDIPSIPR